MCYYARWELIVFIFIQKKEFGSSRFYKQIMDGFRRKNTLEDFRNKTFCINTLNILSFLFAPEHLFLTRAATVNSLLSEAKQVLASCPVTNLPNHMNQKPTFFPAFTSLTFLLQLDVFLSKPLSHLMTKEPLKVHCGLLQHPNSMF